MILFKNWDFNFRFDSCIDEIFYFKGRIFILRSNFYFKIEFLSSVQTFILRSNFYFVVKFLFWGQISIFEFQFLFWRQVFIMKSDFPFLKIESLSGGQSLILRSKFDFEVKVWFWGQSSILRLEFEFCVRCVSVNCALDLII